MHARRSSFRRPLIAFLMVAASTVYALAQKAPVLTRVRGEIVSVDGDTLMVKSRAGEDFKLQMTADTRVAAITKISLSDIKVGSFIGTRTGPGPDGRPT